MAVGEVFEVSIIGGMRGKSPTVVLGFEQIEDVTGLDMAVLANGIEAVLAEATSLWSVEFEWQVIQVRSVTNPTRGLDVEISVVGTASGDAAPMQTAAIVAKKSGLIGASRNGRTFWPGLPESYGNASFISGAYQSALGDMMENLRILVAESVEEFKMVIISRTPTLLVTDVVQLITREVTGTQRRRRPAA